MLSEFYSPILLHEKQDSGGCLVLTLWIFDMLLLRLNLASFRSILQRLTCYFPYSTRVRVFASAFVNDVIFPRNKPGCEC